MRAIFGQSEFRIKETQNNGKFLSYQLCRLINSAWILELIFIKKRDLKGFKCMTVRLDVFGDIPRLFQYFVNDSNILRKIQLFCESFNYFVNHFNML